MHVQTILQLFPQHIKEKLEKHLMSHWEQLEEIRLRIGQPIECISSHRNCWFEDIVFTMNDCIYIMNQLSEHSLYRFEEELKEGYITIRGGHRIGLAGKVQLEDGKVKRIQFITFLNIRIAKRETRYRKQFSSFFIR